MESFYGGRQGASVVIKGSFKYITNEQEGSNYIDPYYGMALETLKSTGMDEDAAKQALAKDTMTVQLSDPKYTDVWYNEYCIIDPVNKNNTNNGRIYRRTLKSTNEDDPVGRIAEYIGQIVGPAGSSPYLGDFTDTTTLQDKFNDDREDLGIDDILTYIGDKGNDEEEWTTATRNASSNLPMKIKPLVTGTNLIAGNTQTNGVYVQQGNYGWYNIRKNTSDTDVSLVYLGFDIPYYITEFENGHALSYAQTNTTVTKTINTGQEIVAPFYEKYQINVPRGVPGAWIDNLQWATTSLENQYYSLSSLTYSAPTENNNWTDSWGISNGASKPSIAINTSVWICDFHWFNKNGQKQDIPNLYIGTYKVIKDITLSDSGSNSGTLTITYTDNSEDSFENKLTWITDALVVTGREQGGDLNNYIGHLLVKFNNSTITPGSTVNTSNNNYAGYRDLGIVKTIQQGLLVESKNYTVSVAATATFADIEQAVREKLDRLTREAATPEDAPSHEKALIVIVTKGEGSSATVEKTIAYWNNGANSGNGQWELLGDTVSGGGGRAEHGAVLEPTETGLEPGSTDLVLSGYSISSTSLTNYPPVFPEDTNMAM